MTLVWHQGNILQWQRDKLKCRTLSSCKTPCAVVSTRGCRLCRARTEPSRSGNPLSVYLRPHTLTPLPLVVSTSIVEHRRAGFVPIQHYPASTNYRPTSTSVDQQRSALINIDDIKGNEALTARITRTSPSFLDHVINTAVESAAAHRSPYIAPDSIYWLQDISHKLGAIPSYTMAAIRN